MVRSSEKLRDFMVWSASRARTHSNRIKPWMRGQEDDLCANPGSTDRRARFTGRMIPFNLKKMVELRTYRLWRRVALDFSKSGRKTSC